MLLLINSHTLVPWSIKLVGNTQLVGILQGYRALNDKPSPVSAPVKPVPMSMAYTSEVGNAGFVSTLQMLSWWYGVQKMDAFYGSYRLPASVVIDHVSDDPALALGLRVSRLAGVDAGKLAFKLPLERGGYQSWTAAGPANGQASGYTLNDLTVDNAEVGVSYVMERYHPEYVIAVDKKTGQKKQFAATATLPNFAFPSAMALDTRHHILSLVTTRGFIYRYDLKHERWIDSQLMKNVGIVSFAYDEAHDRYVALNRYGMLLFISSEGKVLVSMPLLKQLPGSGLLYGDDDGRMQAPMIIPRENGAVLVGYAGDTVKLVWYLDYVQNQTRLTYSSY